MKNIDFNLFKTFYIVAKNKSFTKASEELYISQPAVTQAIKKLEEQLNTELFKRLNNRIELTPSGEIVFYYAEQLCNMIIANNNLLEQINYLSYSTINIGVPTHLGAFYLIDYLKKFNNLHPETHINIVNKKSEEMLKMLEKRELDIVIDTDMFLDDKNLLSKIDIMNLQGCFVGGEKYKNLANKKISPENVNDYPLILPSKSTSNRKVLDLYFREKNVLLKPLIEANSSSISKAIITNGLGIGWMIKEFVKNDLDKGLLYEIKIDIDEVLIPVSVAYNKKYVSKSVKELISILKK